jgi:hypothetical protein
MLHEVIQTKVHVIAFDLEGLAIEILRADLLPFRSLDDEGSMQDDPVWYIKNMSIFLYEPFNSLDMWILLGIMKPGVIFYHVQEMLEKNEPIVVVNIFVSTKRKLRNVLVTVRVEHSKCIFNCL